MAIPCVLQSKRDNHSGIAFQGSLSALSFRTVPIKNNVLALAHVILECSLWAIEASKSVQKLRVTRRTGASSTQELHKLQVPVPSFTGTIILITYQSPHAIQLNLRSPPSSIPIFIFPCLPHGQGTHASTTAV